MEWWNAVTAWVGSAEGRAILTTVIVPFVAIVIAGVVAGLIGRASAKQLLGSQSREARIAAVTALIAGARRSAEWNELSGSEQRHFDYLATEADVRLRLVGGHGSTMAADWAAHQIATLRETSVQFGRPSEQSLLEVRDRLVWWQRSPRRAKKLFSADLEQWSYGRVQGGDAAEPRQPVTDVLVTPQSP